VRPPLLGASPPGRRPATGQGRELHRAAALLGAGLPALARARLRSLAPGAPPGQAARLAQLAEEAGEPALALQLARDRLPPSQRSLGWLYPDPWPGRPPVLSGAGVPRHLLLALVRRESGFRPTARSAAGAEGLVQLLPDTADRLAAAAGVPAGGASLHDPASARPLGALYLGLLADRFGDPAPALAAYNAGPEAALAWARALARMPLDEWVEDLPYRETRRYLKAVLADAQVYRWLYGDGDLEIDGLRPVPPPGEGIAF
jgi:soluble lytic murein transglycosylase